MISNKLIGERLASAREKTGAKNPRQFAIEANIDASQYLKVEAGEKGLSFEKLTDLCSAWGINLDWVLTGKGRVLLTDPDDGLNKTLELGNINVTVGEYIELQKAHIALLQRNVASSMKDGGLLQELVKTVRIDHSVMMEALDQVLKVELGTLSTRAGKKRNAVEENTKEAGSPKNKGN